jgi:hypothetical protein
VISGKEIVIRISGFCPCIPNYIQDLLCNGFTNAGNTGQVVPVGGHDGSTVPKRSRRLRAFRAYLGKAPEYVELPLSLTFRAMKRAIDRPLQLVGGATNQPCRLGWITRPQDRNVSYDQQHDQGALYRLVAHLQEIDVERIALDYVCRTIGRRHRPLSLPKKATINQGKPEVPRSLPLEDNAIVDEIISTLQALNHERRIVATPQSRRPRAHDHLRQRPYDNHPLRKFGAG